MFFSDSPVQVFNRGAGEDASSLNATNALASLPADSLLESGEGSFLHTLQQVRSCHFHVLHHALHGAALKQVCVPGFDRHRFAACILSCHIYVTLTATCYCRTSQVFSETRARCPLSPVSRT